MLLFLSTALAAQTTSPPRGGDDHGASVAMSFIENRGQIVDADGNRRSDILYVAGGGPARMYLRRGAISYVFARIEMDSAAGGDPMGLRRPERDLDSRRRGTITTYRMDVDLVGANPDAVVTSEEPGVYRTNYYLPQCPDGITGVGSYRRVVYHDIYPKIDLVFHTAGGGIKYDFLVHPGGDPSDIVLRYIGADDLHLDADGGVRARNMLGTLSEGRPVSWQAGGAVECRYGVKGSEVRFAMGGYDRRAELVIDPLLEWATYVGGSGSDTWGGVSWSPEIGKTLATDVAGNVVMTGTTSSIDFPILAATPFQGALQGGIDVYILKLDGDGRPLWSTYVGGGGDDGASGIAVDPVTSSLDICGETASADFPVTPGAMQGTHGADVDAFIGQFDSTGARRWITFFGGNSRDEAIDIDADDAGNIVVVGSEHSTDLAIPDPLPGVGHHVFVMKMTPAGNRVWATLYGGTGTYSCTAVSIDRSGHIVVAGDVQPVDAGQIALPLTAGTFQPAFAGLIDGFVATLDANGVCLWSTYVGGGGVDDLSGAVTDSADNIIVCGRTTSVNFPATPSGFQPTFAGGVWDAFVMKLDPTGGRIWGTYYGGSVMAPSTSEGDVASDLAVTPDNAIVVVGTTQSIDLPITADAFQSTLRNWGSPFLLRLRADGSREWASYYGSSEPSSTDNGQTVAVDDMGNVYIAGATRMATRSLPGADLGFQPGFGGGFQDAFIAKFGGFCRTDPVIPPVAVLCGDAPSATLHAPPGFRTYRWSPGGATTQDITVTDPGTYTLDVRSYSGCLGSATVEVRRVPKPRPVILPSPSFDICEGDSVKLDATALGILSYTWSTGETTPSIWTKRAGQYTVRVIDTNGCIDTSAAVTVRVFARPDKPVLPAGPIRICPDSVLVLTAGGTFKSYKWSTGATTPSIKVSTAGKYWVIGYNELGCASTSDTVTVLLNARPVPRIVVHGSGIACQGESVDLEVTGGQFSRIRWSSGEQTAAIKASRPGVYSVQVWSLEGCRGGPDTATVTILPGPMASISGPEMVCVNATVVYRTVEGFAQSYRWTLEGDGAIVGPADRSSLTVKWGSEGSGTLRLEVVDTRTGCRTVVERSVTIGTELKPVIVALGPTVFCQGDSVMLDGGFAMKSYRWSTGDTTEYIMVKAAGAYSVSVEDSGGCKGRSNPITIEVVPRPAPRISGAVKVCLNGTAIYTAADVPGHEYTWFVNGGVILSGQGSSSITVQWGAGPGGTVDLAEASGQGLCAGKAPQLAVEIGAELQPAITASGPTSFCRGDSVVLDAGDGYDSYLWSSGQSTRRITVRESGSYSVTVADAGGCGGSSAPVAVVVSPPADPVIRVVGPTVFCSGDSTVLDAGADFASYRWSSGETTQLIVARAAGSYSVEVTTAGGCRARSAAVAIGVEERPRPLISGAVKVCQGSTVVYSTPAVAGHGYVWSTGGGVIVAGQGTDRISVQWGSGPTGVIDLVESNASGRCQGVARRYEVAIGTELEPVIVPGGRIDLCAGDSTELDAGDGYARYEWTTGETSRRIIVKGSGVYGVKVWDAGGCNGSSKEVEVEVHAPPVARITPSGPVELVAGDSVVLDAGGGFVGYRWSNGDTTHAITVKEKGSYGVMVVDAFGCRGEAGPVEVDVTPPVGPGRGNAVVEIPAIEAVPGETVRLRLSLRGSRDLPAVPLAYTARVRFRASLLAPSGATPSGMIDGADRVLDLRGVLPAGVASGPLADLEMLALLGDTETTALHLESFAWSDTTIATEPRDGSFTLKGLCVTGPTRLVGESGRFALKGVRPNPAGDRAEIEYELDENGPAGLEMIDMLGRRVMMLGDVGGAPGLYRMTVDVSALPSGRYMIVLRSPTRRTIIPMQIGR